MCRFFVCLIFTALPRRKSLLSILAWTNIHATIPQIIGLLLRSARFFSFYRIFISDTHFVCRFFVCLIFTALPRRKSLLSIHAWTNIHATIPQIVGLLLRSARFYSFFRTMQAARICVPLFFSQKHADFVRKNKSPSKTLGDFVCSTALIMLVL